MSAILPPISDDDLVLTLLSPSRSVFDSSDTNSFSYISNLRVSRAQWSARSSCSTLTRFYPSLLVQQQYKLNHIPSLFVATKSDLDLAQQRHEVQPDVYTKRLGLQVPISVSVREGESLLVTTTAKPWAYSNASLSLPLISTRSNG